MRFRLHVLMIVAAMVGMSCKTHQAAVAPFAPPVTQSVPNPESPRTFKQAIFFRPIEGSAGGIEEQMAPLIIEEAHEHETPGRNFDAGIPGCMPNVQELPMTTPTICFERHQITIGGIAYERIHYAWYTCGWDADFIDLWITLGKNGMPLVYEAESTASKVRHYYVSMSLEAAAEKEFGAPLPGCRYSIERSLSEMMPLASVQRTIDDGPMPLGPYVYVSKDPLRVVTITCRCEKSLAQTFLAEPQYNFQSLDEFLNWTYHRYMWPTPELTASLCPSGVGMFFKQNRVEQAAAMDDLFRWPTKMPE